jgi:hypothetical protein
MRSPGLGPALVLEHRAGNDGTARVLANQLAVGDRQDIKRLKAALDGKDKAQINALDDELKANGRGSLRGQLLDKPEWATCVVLAGTRTMRPKEGSLCDEIGDVLEILDLGGMPTQDPGGDEFSSLVVEGRWYWNKIQTLCERAMARRGTFARLRDWNGNQEHDLVDRARDRAEAAFKALTDHATTKSADAAMDQVKALKDSFSRLRYNLGVYTAATEAAFVNFVDVAVNVVSRAMTFIPGRQVAGFYDRPRAQLVPSSSCSATSTPQTSSWPISSTRCCPRRAIAWPRV